MYLNRAEADGLMRCIDGTSDDAMVKLSRVDSLGNDRTRQGDGFLRVIVWDPSFLDGTDTYIADDVISEMGSITSWATSTQLNDLLSRVRALGFGVATSTAADRVAA